MMEMKIDIAMLKATIAQLQVWRGESPGCVCVRERERER